MIKNWWKILAVVLVLYAIIGGFLIDVPRLPILNESIRNLFFHVCMWFSMSLMLLAALIYSIIALANPKNYKADMYASELVNTAVFMGALGLITGSIWAQFTWGAFWVNDPKLNGSAITMLTYIAYIILRNSFEEEQKRARVSAVYNIFAFVLMFVFIWVLPRLTDSLHPGNGGNPAFGQYDLDSNMRLVFYPAIIGWTLLGLWIGQLRLRVRLLQRKRLYDNAGNYTLYEDN